MFFGSKNILNHKERIMNNVLKKCSEEFKKMERELLAPSVSKTQLKVMYKKVEETYQSMLHIIF